MNEWIIKLTWCLNRSSVKRCKERCLEEAIQLLRQIPEALLHALEESHLLPLVRLLISMQLQVVSNSTACRKVDQVSPPACLLTVQRLKTTMETHCNFTFVWQMLQHLAKVDHQLVFRETQHCLRSIVYSDQVQSSHLVCLSHICTTDDFYHVFFSGLVFWGSAERLVPAKSDNSICKFVL